MLATMWHLRPRFLPKVVQSTRQGTVQSTREVADRG